MKKREIRKKLEKLYEAQETYFKLLDEFQEIFSQMDEIVDLWNVVGSIDGFGIESVEKSMTALENEMKLSGLEWDDLKIEKGKEKEEDSTQKVYPFQYEKYNGVDVENEIIER